MTLSALLCNYTGSAIVTIEGYCEEQFYNYYRDVEDWELSDNNPNRHKPTAITREPWWNEVKDMQVERWDVIGGGINPPELYIIICNS